MLIGGVVLATAVVSPVGGAAATAATAPVGDPTPSVTGAAARGEAFDPARAYVPGSSPAARTPGAPSAPPAAGGAGTPAAVDANGGSLAFGVQSGLETAQGAPLTSTLPGGDSLQVFDLGVVSRVRADGSTVWQRGTASLYHDWQLSFTGAGYTPTPQLAVGTDPADPFELTTAVPYAVRDTHPYAVGDLAGDGGLDIAVAETVGINFGAASCGSCGWPFTVPGSDQHLGTFVTVLDGRTGQTLYHELDPGFVTQLAISGNELLIGDETGSPTSQNGPGAWDSASTVRALTLRGTPHGAPGALTATEAWHYSTGSQWGRLLGMQAVGGGVAVSWSDTPLGLGVPGPPDGHVVLLDGTGRVRWDQRTAGYPVLTRYDQARDELAVVEQTDPTRAISYTLAGLRVSDGRTVSATTTGDVLPTTLTIGALSAHARPSWIVTGVATTADQVRVPYYAFTAGTVSAVDPDKATTQWSHTLAAGPQSAPQPGAVEVVAGANGAASVVVGSWLGSRTPTVAAPYGESDDLQALSGDTGAALWRRSGDVGDPLSLATTGTSVRGVTAEEDAVSYDAAGGTPEGTAPLLGSLYSAVSADVNGDGTPDYLTGGQSGAVYAVDGATLTPADDAPRILWRADVGGPVHQIVPATLGGKQVLAVAATSGLALIDARTGKVLRTMPLPGQYVWNVAVGSAGSRTVVVTATDRLSAFDANTGKPVWTYRAPVAAYFADASVVDGVVVTEYQNQVATNQAATSMAALGIDAGTGRLVWTTAADPATTRAAQLRNGVIAGAGIPGAGSDGAAFTWGTSNGQGRVDVRDARTGNLVYSNTSGLLANHESYVIDPAAGLVSTGESGTVSIAPSGPVGTGWISGSDLAVADAGGTPVLLTAQAGVNAYPMSALSAGDTLVSPLASGSAYLPAKLAVTPDDRVLTMPIDWTAHEVLSVEAGQNARPYTVAVQQGLAVQRLTGTPAANAARQQVMPPNVPVSRPATLPLGDTTASGARIGTAQPAGEIEVHGYDSAGTPQLTASAPAGYDPAAMRAYLGLRGTGAGQTVAVVDAPGDPGITADVNQFSAQFGLPQVCSGGATTGCFAFSVTAAGVAGTADPSWGLETAMDVEWIHAVAPQAAVVLVEASDGTFASLFHAVGVAEGLHPDTISMSWGLPEEFTDETYYGNSCRLTASLCVVASGDAGHPGSYPAYDPAVLAVGGTTLHLAADGTVTGETAWSGSGGGRSYVEPTPAYQQGVVTGGRGIPDVSFDADPVTGVAVYDTSPVQGQTGWFQVGGTSLGAPTWSAIIASADQLRDAAGKPRLVAANGAAQQAIYAAAGQLGDVVSGPPNGFCPGLCSAGTGYDYVTGLGSPRTGLDATLAAAP
ncbi:MAG TPA: PQQ-binding-like beta-propeller repeat protein [Amycolatopsis sp.]|nr:PQQ-binding-like beta-propeller repeat protein [Amycolatopsis sp.]